MGSQVACIIRGRCLESVGEFSCQGDSFVGPGECSLWRWVEEEEGPDGRGVFGVFDFVGDAGSDERTHRVACEEEGSVFEVMFVEVLGEFTGELMRMQRQGIW